MPYLPDIYVEQSADLFDPSRDLLERCDDFSPANSSFNLEGDEATVVYEIPHNKMRSFLRFMLGFSYVHPPRPASALKLRRENPQYHPIFPWMHAHSVGFQGFALDGANGLQAAGPNAKSSWFSRLFSRSYIGVFGRYKRCYATVKFKSVPWAVLDDDDPLVAGYGEVARNSFVDLAPSVESLDAEGPLSQLLWNETSAAAGPDPGGPTIGRPVSSKFNTLVSKTQFTLNLVNFPQEFFSAESVPNKPFVPKNLLACVGRVNSADFLGFPAGCLLLQPPKLQRFRWPIFTSATSLPFFGYNVALPLMHFDPDRAGTNTTRGYRLMPWAPNLLWYSAVRQHNGKYLLPEADFNTIFEIPVF